MPTADPGITPGEVLFVLCLLAVAAPIIAASLRRRPLHDPDYPDVAPVTGDEAETEPNPTEEVAPCPRSPI